GQPPPPHPAGQPVNRRLLLGAGAAGVAVSGAGKWWSFNRSRTGSPVLVGQAAPEASRPASGPADPGKLSVTVLPFKNLTNDRAQEYFSDGQTDAIVTALIQLSGLTMVSPQSAFLLGKRDIDLRTIGTLLHVNYVI